MPLFGAKTPPPDSTKTINSYNTVQAKRRGPGWTKADALQPLDDHEEVREDMLEAASVPDASDVTDRDEEDKWVASKVSQSHMCGFQWLCN